MQSLNRRLIQTEYGHIHMMESADYHSDLIPVICLHMSGHSGRAFQPLIELSKTSRRYIAIDYPGYGDSDPPPRGRDLSVSDYAKIAWSVADELELDFVHLFGHHTGSKVATEMAFNSPDRVGQIVLAAASSRPTSTTDDPLPIEEILKADYSIKIWGEIEAYFGNACEQQFKFDIFKEMIKSGPYQSSAQKAAQRYNQQFIESLPQLDHKVTVVNLGDELQDETPKIMKYLKCGKLVEKTEWQHGFLGKFSLDVLDFLEFEFQS